MEKSLLIAEIKEAFEDLSYPNYDYFNAIVDRDYLDISEVKVSDERKLWRDVSKDEVIKYYDFIFYLKNEGVIYYLPAYMINIVEHEDIASGYPSESAFMAIADIVIDSLSDKQLNAIRDFLIYCRDNVQKRIELDEALLDTAMEHVMVS